MKLATIMRGFVLDLALSSHFCRDPADPGETILQTAEHNAVNSANTREAVMRVKLLIGIAAPLVLVSAPAMAFGVLGLIGSIAGLTVGAAGGAALSSGGVGSAGRPGATAFSPAPGAGPAGQTAWATTGSVDTFASLMPSGSRAVSQTAIRVSDLGWVYGSPDTLKELGRPLRRRPGLDRRTVRVCRDALARTFAAHGAVQVEAASAGRSSRQAYAMFAPLTARVIYRLSSGYEVKQATITCQVTRAGAAVLAR